MVLKKLATGRHRTLVLAAVILLLGAAFQFADVNPAVSQTAALTAYRSSTDPGLDPNSSAWKNAVFVQVPLTAQAGQYFAGGGSIPVVIAKALNYGNKLYVRLEWNDDTVDDSTTRVQDFADAAAVEFPARTASTVPSICMGQADAGVNIWQWRADSQVGVKDPIGVHPNAQVDLYPSTDPLLYTARAVGNPYANPNQGPIQTLIAQTFGTLAPAAVQDVKGAGVHKDGKWAVVFTREFAAADGDQARFAVGAKTDMAVAIWNGSQQDRDGHKSVSQFITLDVTAMEVTGKPGIDRTAVVLAAVLFFGVSGLGAGLAVYGSRESRGPR